MPQDQLVGQTNNFNFNDWLNYQTGRQRATATDPFFRGKQGLPNALGSAGGSYLAGLSPAAATGSAISFSSLLDILSKRGATDPAMMNRDLADISRTTQSGVDAMQGNLAQNNMQRSGVGAMVQGAMQNAGAERRSQRLAEETQRTEARRRSDLDMFQKILGGPALNSASIASGIPPRQDDPSDFENFMTGFSTVLGLL